MTAPGDLPVVVFSGTRQDAAFLLSLLTGSGIEATLDAEAITGVVYVVRQPRVLVRRRDLERALPLIEDFEKNGKKSRRD